MAFFLVAFFLAAFFFALIAAPFQSNIVTRTIPSNSATVPKSGLLRTGW